MGPWGYMPWYGMIIGPLIMIAVLFVFIRLLGDGGNVSRYNQDNNVQSGSALDILEERFAKGEIDQKEFEEKKRVLEK